MRGRHRGEHRLRCGRPRTHNEAAGERAASTAVAPPLLPQDFAPELAVSARWRGAREEGQGGSRRGEDPSAGSSDWHLWAQWNHGHARLYFD